MDINKGYYDSIDLPVALSPPLPSNPPSNISEITCSSSVSLYSGQPQSTSEIE